MAACAAPKTAQKAKRLIPMLNRILVKRADPEMETKGGILLPDSKKEKVARGTVIAVGPGTKTEAGKQVPMSLKPGDQVLLPEYGGTRVMFDEQEYFMFREPDVVGKIIE